MGKPTQSVVKRLFSVSGNVCSFPKCKTELIYRDTGKVIGKICHIKGNKPGSARHDPDQSEEDRQSFDNLILMCGVHHDVIDDDPESYTVERLIKIKKEHEEKAVSENVLESQLFQQFVNNIEGVSVENGSLILNQGQIGGQVAHSIINNGPQPRVLNASAIRCISEELKKHASHEYNIEYNSDDSDGRRLVYQLADALNNAGWICKSAASCQYPHPMVGISISYPEKTDGVSMLIDLLIRAGFSPQEKSISVLNEVHIIVGYPDH